MPAFDALLNQTATLYAITGRDQYAKPTYGAGVVVSCRFDDASNVKLKLADQEIVVTEVMTVPAATVVSENAKVVDGDGDTFRVVMINVVPDRFGDIHHKQLGLQAWNI